MLSGKTGALTFLVGIASAVYQYYYGPIETVDPEVWWGVLTSVAFASRVRAREPVNLVGVAQVLRALERIVNGFQQSRKDQP